MTVNAYAIGAYAFEGVGRPLVTRLVRLGLVGVVLRFAGARVVGWIERRLRRPIGAVR